MLIYVCYLCVGNVRLVCVVGWVCCDLVGCGYCLIGCLILVVAGGCLTVSLAL